MVAQHCAGALRAGVAGVHCRRAAPPRVAACRRYVATPLGLPTRRTHAVREVHAHGCVCARCLWGADTVHAGALQTAGAEAARRRAAAFRSGRALAMHQCGACAVLVVALDPLTHRHRAARPPQTTGYTRNRCACGFDVPAVSDAAQYARNRQQSELMKVRGSCAAPAPANQSMHALSFGVGARRGGSGGGGGSFGAPCCAAHSWKQRCVRRSQRWLGPDN